MRWRLSRDAAAKMHSRDQDFELACRHLAEADARISNQRRLLAWLESLGHPTELAEQLLKSLIDTRAQMQAHRDYLAGATRRS